MVIIYILVNFTGLGYMHNILGNRQFRIVCLVLVVEGVISYFSLLLECFDSGFLLLLTVVPGHQCWRRIQKKCAVRSRTGRILTETLYLCVSLALLTVPLVGGVLLQASSQQEQVVMMFGRESLEEESQELSIVLLSRLNSLQPGDDTHQWTQVVIIVVGD